MPKVKPRKAVLKRMKFTANGKVKRQHVGLGHLCAKKSANRKRKLRRPGLIAGNELYKIRGMVHARIGRRPK